VEKKATEPVWGMMAVKDISAGTIVGEDPRDIFEPVKLEAEDGKPLNNLFLDSWSGQIKGKKVARELKKGEVVKRNDIVEPDGSPFRPPSER
jgi:hypothetical protein